MKASENQIKKAIIFELARVTDFDGIKTAFIYARGRVYRLTGWRWLRWYIKEN